MNKWKLVSITLGLGILLFGFYSLNNDVEMVKYKKEKASVTRALSHYFQLNSQIMGTQIENIECDLVRDKMLLSCFTQINFKH